MNINTFGSRTFRSVVLAGGMAVCATFICLYFSVESRSQGQKIVWSDKEKPIVEDIRKLRSLSEEARVQKTREIGLKIRLLPAGMNRVRLATSLASLSTEGDLGQDTLQDVATTLSEALREQQIPAGPHGSPTPYIELANLARYEHVDVTLGDPQYAAAVAKVEADELRRQQADFRLTDLQGKTWALKELRGQVVLVDFWATWCPPCRREMPDLQSAYERFKSDGLIVLAITDEEPVKVKPFVEQNGFSYPIVLDPDKSAHRQFTIMGLPRSFVFDRDGKLVAEAIDVRTEKQLLEMLAKAGLQ